MLIRDWTFKMNISFTGLENRIKAVEETSTTNSRCDDSYLQLECLTRNDVLELWEYFRKRDDTVHAEDDERSLNLIAMSKIRGAFELHQIAVWDIRSSVVEGVSRPG